MKTPRRPASDAGVSSEFGQAIEQRIGFGRPWRFQWGVDGVAAQQCLYLRPLPQGHGSFRPILGFFLGKAACAAARRCGAKRR